MIVSAADDTNTMIASTLNTIASATGTTPITTTAIIDTIDTTDTSIITNVTASSRTNATTNTQQSNRKLFLYKLIVQYDGTRFNGFQRQIDNTTFHQQWNSNNSSNNSSSSKKRKNNTNSTSTMNTNLYSKLVPKRPHYDNNDRMNSNTIGTGKRKQCDTITIQECLEISILDLLWYCFNNKNNASSKKYDSHKNTNSHQLTDNNNKSKIDHINQKECSSIQNANDNTSEMNHDPDLPVVDHPINQQQQLQQKENDESLFTVHDLCLRFAGRTDKGVHATGQVVTVYLPVVDDIIRLLVQEKKQCDTTTCSTNGTSTDDTTSTCIDNLQLFWKLQLLRKGWNSRLPIDISIQQIFLVPVPINNNNNNTCTSNDNEVVLYFDPRRHVTKKQYSYTVQYIRRRKQQQQECNVSTSVDNITNNNDSVLLQYSVFGPHMIRNAINTNTIWICPWIIDDTHLCNYCTELQGYHNFYNFIHRDTRVTINNNNNNNKDTTTEDTSCCCLTIDTITYTIVSEEKYDTTDKTIFKQQQPQQQQDQEQQSSLLPSSSLKTATISKDIVQQVNNNIVNYENDDDNESSFVVVTGRFVLQAKGFQRTLVRNIVGYCIDQCRYNNDKHHNDHNVASDSSCTVPSSLSCADDALHISQQQSNNNQNDVNHDKNNNNNNASNTGTCSSTTTSSSCTIDPNVWIPNEQFASTKIHAAPACGLCLDSVWY